ncbi:hypothetical protein [Luteipulveratus halotolerans]|uniref:Uncharacterized protein n=1 Tax=Luteipulveratus halotolerans TaxID=1631356 RepID=A0A0L6CPL8_9MICO|nr:hypothetical protein [Luteipulveratus halotolerans]KNX39668.1 hypothetical protein VV01_00060 [Luteipulveratus halotolerans]KNX39711.1 hypothetical protein VV01_00315 [Luteipulveratus halotolerans]
MDKSTNQNDIARLNAELQIAQLAKAQHMDRAKMAAGSATFAAVCLVALLSIPWVFDLLVDAQVKTEGAFALTMWLGTVFLGVIFIGCLGVTWFHLLRVASASRDALDALRRLGPEGYAAGAQR